MTRAPIKGTTLAWARAVLGVEPSELAHAAGVRVEVILAWENDVAHPTIGQLRSIAQKLERTPAFFFGPPPAETGVPAVPDFRGRGAEGIPTSILREMKRAEEHRATLVELAGFPDQRLELTPFDRDSVAEVAAAVRDQLAGTLHRPLPTAPAEMFSLWRETLSELGVLVFQSTRIPLQLYRGLSIQHDNYPIVLINGSDAANGKIFTLFHELGHLANRSSGLCLVVENGDAETLSNMFASEVLMPATEVAAFLERTRATKPVSAVATHFRVSELAAAVRLRTLGQLTQESLDRWRQANDDQWAQNRRAMAEKDGFVPQWRLKYRDLGPKYVGVVLGALERNQIDHLAAAYMLNARVPMVEQLQAEFHRRGDA